MSTSQTEQVGAKTVTHFRKPERSFWQIWNMSFGFLGIQFGWGLQMANMSAIYEYLGARADQIPILWLAAPLTGLIVQPHHRPRQRSHLGASGPAAAVFPGRRDSEFAGADPDAAMLRRCGWRPGCSGFWMLPSTSAWSRSARSSPTFCPKGSAPRLRHAEPVHRTGRGRCVGAAHGC